MNGNMYYEKNSFEDFLYLVRKYIYDSQEFGLMEQLDLYIDFILDLNGVRFLENSVKILIKRIEEFYFGKFVLVINFGGCIFECNLDIGMFDFLNFIVGVFCLDYKFMYFYSVFFVEVIDDIDEEKGLKVFIWFFFIMIILININLMFSFGGVQVGVLFEIIDQLVQN